MGILPVRKYLEDDGDSTKPFKFKNVPPSDIILVFECEDCNIIEKDDVSNVAYNGAPICSKCNNVMMLSHGEVKV